MTRFTLTVAGKNPVSGEMVLESSTPLPPNRLFVFTLPDDLLPPASLPGRVNDKDPIHPLTDDELRQVPDLWPFPDAWRKPRKPDNIPATVTTYKKGSFTHSTPWLNYWACNCSLAWFNVYDYNELRGTPYWDPFDERAWLSFTLGTRVVTNGNGHDDGYFDPISGENDGATPMGIDALLMERNIVELTSLRRERYGGITGYLFACFDGDSLPPDMHEENYRNAPWKFSFANILKGHEEYPNENMGLDPFSQGWQFGGHSPFPNVCMPDKLLPGGVNLVPENRIHLTNGVAALIDSVPNQYNPERYLQ